MTANRALRELAADGVLVRVAGVGTFVAEQRAQAHPLEVRNIADEIRSARPRIPGEGRLPRLHHAPRANWPSAAASRPGRELDHTLLVHFEGGVPLQVEDRYVNPTVVPGYLQNDFSRTTPHEYLMQAAPLQRAEHTVRAVLPDKRIGRMLKLEAGDACLLIMRRTWSFERIATVADLYHPGSRYELSGAFQPRSSNV